MVVTIGVSAGFVTTAPTADPAGTNNSNLGTVSMAQKDVVPNGYNTVTEMGWYADNSGTAMDYDLGIYDHNVGDNNPEAVVGTLSINNAAGTGAGWKVVTGLSIPVTAGATMWVAMQQDTGGNYDSNYENDAGEKQDIKTIQTALPDPWGVSDNTFGQLWAVYALVENVVTGGKDIFSYNDPFINICYPA